MRKLDCPYINQRERYPTGCESVSAVMLLRYLGYDASVEDFIDRCLPRAPEPRLEEDGWHGPDPRQFYPGDPYTDDGWGCFAPAVKRGLETYLGDDRAFEIREIYGRTMDDLAREYVDNGMPVIVFATMGMAEPKPYRSWKIDGEDRVYTWKTPMHCLLLTGYDEEGFYFHDPLECAHCFYPRRMCESAFLKMGAEAVVSLKCVK
jgi:uncharacterized protein YvpB